MDYHSLGLWVLCYLLAPLLLSGVFYQKRKWASFFSLMTALLFSISIPVSSTPIRSAEVSEGNLRKILKRMEAGG